MAKSDFKCQKCKTVKSEALFRTHRKYQCPSCGRICKDCITSGLFTAPKCKHCGSQVMVYEWTGEKWTKE